LRLTTTVVLAVLLIGGKPVFCRLGSDGSVGRSGIQSDDFVEFRFADVVLVSASENVFLLLRHRRCSKIS